MGIIQGNRPVEATQEEIMAARLWLAQSRDYRSIPVGAKQTMALSRGCKALVKAGEAASRIKVPGRHTVYRLRSAARAQLSS